MIGSRLQNFTRQRKGKIPKIFKIVFWLELSKIEFTSLWENTAIPGLDYHVDFRENMDWCGKVLVGKI